MMLYPRRLDSARREIRTVTITGFDEEDRVICKLCSCSLDDHLQYTALSYAWGDPAVTKQIIVNGEVFQATTSLELALRHLKDVRTPLWADAICINQDDVLEKQEQIPLMGDIYSLAAHVLIWLGPSDALVDKLWPLLESIPNAETALLFLLLQCRLSTSPWFDRVWTLQESILASADPTFQCGCHAVTWTRLIGILKDAAGWYMRLQDVPSAWRDDPDVASMLASMNSNPMEIMARCSDLPLRGLLRGSKGEQKECRPPDIITIMVDRKATLPHDDVFGILAVMPPEIREGVPVRYDVSHWQVYESFMARLLDFEKAACLSEFSYVGEAFHGRCSWIPDFASQSTTGPDSVRLLVSQVWEPWSDQEIQACNDGVRTLLVLQGAVLGTVTAVKLMTDTKLASDDPVVENFPDWTNWVERLVGIADVKNVIVLFAGTGSETFSKENLPWNELQEPMRLQDLSLHNFGHKGTDDRAETPEISSRRSRMGVLASFIHATTLGKILFATKEGSLGIGPPKTAVGDVLVYFYGALAPFVLRPRGEEFWVIGPVRVLGLMTGEDVSSFCKQNQCPARSFRIGYSCSMH